MGDFDVESKDEADQKDRLYVDTLAQKVDAELRNPDVNWASKVDAARDGGSDFILREAVSGGDGGTPTIDGDLDMLMYDILNIDTLRFKSDSPFHITSDKAQIRSNLLGEELNFYVPTGKSHLFYIGNTIEMSLSSAINTLRSDVRFDGNVTAKRNVSVEGNISTDGTVDADKEIKVGSLTASDTAPSGSSDNGSIWYDAPNNKLKAIINGVAVNLGEGGGGTGPPPPTIPTPNPSGGTYLSIHRYLHTTLAAHTAGELDSLFGGQPSRIGILRPNTLDTGDPGEVYLVFKNPTTSGTTKKWLGIAFDGVLSTTQSTSGLRDDVLHYNDRQIAYVGTNRSDAYNEMIPYDDRVKGRWGIYAENDDIDDASIFVYNTGSRDPNISGTLKFKRETDELGASVPFGDALSGIVSHTLLSLEGSTHTVAGLDSAFGADDGCIGARLPGNTGNRFYAKVGGYWFYISLTFSG